MCSIFGALQAKGYLVMEFSDEKNSSVNSKESTRVSECWYWGYNNYTLPIDLQGNGEKFGESTNSSLFL